MYKKSKDIAAIIRLFDGATVPKDPINVDYQAFLLWESEGNIIADAQTPEEAAQEAIDLNNAAIKAELLDNDLKAIRALIEDDKVRIAKIKKDQSDRRKRLVPPGE